MDEYYEQIHDDILSRFSDKFRASLEINDGWLDLIYRLHTKLAYISPEYKLHHVKQKFGVLRYYATYVPDESEEYPETMEFIFNDIIALAEINSQIICETCGRWGEMVTKGYSVYVACDEHKDRLFP